MFANPLRRQRGHVLLDALIAIFVGTVVIISLVSVILSGLVAAEAARQNNVAFNCARQIVENIRLRRGAVLTDGTYADATVFGPVPQLNTLRSGTVSVRILQWQPSIKNVIVTVQWRAGQNGGARRSRVVSALIGAKGVSL